MDHQFFHEVQTGLVILLLGYELGSAEILHRLHPLPQPFIALREVYQPNVLVPFAGELDLLLVVFDGSREVVHLHVHDPKGVHY